MGCCCSIHAADEEADAEAKWTEEQPCKCSRQYSFTTSLEYVVVPITSCCCCDRAREAVQATIKCDLCDRQFRRTYELRYHEKRKYKRWGYYGKYTKVESQSADRFSFAHLEQCYALMEQYLTYPRARAGRKRRKLPDNDWAEDFYQLVTAGEG